MTGARRPDTPFWVERSGVMGDRLRLGPEESHHLLRVHRAGTGAPFQAIDGEGSLYECVLESVERRSAIGRIVDRRTSVGELDYPIRLIVGLPDWGALERLTALAVPLGASVLDIVPCARTGRAALGAPRLGRLYRLARAGLKQSRRTNLPEIRSSTSLKQALGLVREGARFAADPDGYPAVNAVGRSGPSAVAIAVGPPGGFVKEERDRLLGERFSFISLGPSRLSTETAAVAMLSFARNSLY